jgi:hypothetical protein
VLIAMGVESYGALRDQDRPHEAIVENAIIRYCSALS